MSLYNMINGVNPCTFFILPLLGKHPEEYPRFRDCFIKDEGHPQYNNHIHVYTRVGGGNRNQGYGEDELREHPLYVDDFDDSYDCTYATYIFKYPPEFKNDIKLVLNGKIMETSQEYKDKIDEVMPKLKGKLPWHKK